MQKESDSKTAKGKIKTQTKNANSDAVELVVSFYVAPTVSRVNLNQKQHKQWDQQRRNY